MSLSKYLVLFLVTIAWLLPCYNAAAQQAGSDSLKAVRQHIADSTKQSTQRRMDSVRNERQKTLDSTRQLQQRRNDSLAAIRKHKESKQYKDSVLKARNTAVTALRTTRTTYLDSVKAARKSILDSAVNARKEITAQQQQKIKLRSDSLNAIRKHKESGRYKDSVLRSRNAHIDSIRAVRAHFVDSSTKLRKKTLDSTFRVRKQLSDSVHKRQQLRSDSMAVIRKYKESKRYRDSVGIMRQNRLDSIRAVRKDFSDSMIAVRKIKADSIKVVRKTHLDSMMAVRKILTDSLKAVRAVRADSMAKLKELRLKNQKAQLKKREDKAKLAIDLKIKKKHEAYSNEKMLKKKWTLIRQGFQNTYTHYNYYYNARRKMTEAQQNMQRRKKDDFENRISLFPFDPNTDSTVFSSDMDTIVRKASVGIQIHDPRTKWGDDLYLLMGQAFYYKGNYESATATFRYIIGMRDGVYKKKKKKNGTLKKDPNTGSLVQKEKSRLSRIFQHQLAHNDAVLWLTRTFTDNNRQADAEAILDLLDASSKLSETMKGKIALEKANLLIKRGSYKEASTQLDLVIQSKAIAKYTRQRASFLNGQILTEMGEYTAAADNYQKTLTLHPPIDMDFYARKNMANSIALSGGDQSRSIASLKQILKDGKYAPYHEQVYFILGKLSANNARYDEALAFYAKSLQLPKTSKKQKAITFAAMGNIQYSQGNYNQAKRSYDSASYFSRNVGAGNEELTQALARGLSLDKVERPYNEVKIKDSLLKLSAMSEKEQKAVIKKYLKYLEQQKADSAANALAASSASSISSAGAPGTTTTWYFSSPVTIQQGANDFKRKWGNRTLGDNWRRAAANAFGADASGTAAAVAEEETEEEELSPEQSLLAAIPKTEAQINAVRQSLRKAYITLAEAYIKNLEDYPAGVTTLDTLDNRFPAHEYGAQALSLRYLAALRQNKSDEAGRLRTKLIAEFPDSEFAHSLSTTDSMATDAVATGQSVSEYYMETYQLADSREYSEALQRSRTGQRSYGDLTYSRKFRILEAISLAGLGRYKHADTVINQYLKEYPSDSLKPWADAVARRIKELQAADTLKKTDTSSSLPAIIKDSSKVLLPGLTKAATDSLKVNTIPDHYSYKSNEIHYCVFVFGKPDTKIAGFKSGLSDFSAFKFSGLALNTTMEMLGTDNSIVITRSFPNAAQARAFLNAGKNESRLFRDIPAGSYQALLISASNFKKLSLDKDIPAYRAFYSKYYK